MLHIIYGCLKANGPDQLFCHTDGSFWLYIYTILQFLRGTEVFFFILQSVYIQFETPYILKITTEINGILNNSIIINSTYNKFYFISAGLIVLMNFR